MASILKVDTLQKPDGSTPTAADLGLDVAGSVVQVVSSGNNVYYNLATTTYTTVGTVTITPKYANSKIMVTYNASGMVDGASIGSTGIRIQRDGTTINRRSRLGYSESTWSPINLTTTVFDEPNSTDPVVYTAQISTESNSFRIGDTDSGTGGNYGDQHTFYVIEIKQ